jgi:cell division protein ZipA
LADELRWILGGLLLVLLGGIWWWGVRQSRQSPGNAQLRESPADNTVVHASADESPDEADLAGEPVSFESRDWGVPPFEPLSIRTAEPRPPALDRPMTSTALAVDLEPAAPVPPPPAPSAPEEQPAAAMQRAAETLSGPDAHPAPAPSANAAELQKLVSIRVCAVGEKRWSGKELMAALELQGLAYGRYQVYHRNHADGRSLFCVASLVEPGTFDPARMPQEEFRGVTLFAVLPGPLEPLQTIDALFAAARGLAERLSGMVQDSKGMPYSPQRAAALREDVARFQALLPA